MIPELKWERVTMDFVFGLPVSPRKKDSIWVNRQINKVGSFYSKIVRLHGVPLSIISNQDLRFTSRFWSKLHKALGTKLHFNTTFHPQTDGQLEQEKHQPLAEFAYNNNYQSSIKMTPFEALYDRKCRTSLYWSK
ncbi:Gag protease polyprotein [Gossypium australe]|uniref:Gag protease polyprotein n=1 Tax=Gossypium australe TaxID=47621 RepID=A0A5B6UZS9_9ROSI|nr:Gag protease polyprotein [Gossypium australe]